MTVTDQILQELKNLTSKITEQGTVITRLEQGQKSLEQGQNAQGLVINRLEQGQNKLEQGQREQGLAIARLEQAHAQTKTMLKVLEAGQNDIRENMVTKADMQDIKTVLLKHQKRIENLEENTNTPNPHKN